MNKQEREQLRNEIQMKNVMTKKIGGWFRNSLIASITFGLLTFWAFNGMKNGLFNVSGLMADIFKWLFLVIAVILFVFSILSFLSFNNSKKHILKLIEKVEKK